jgi:hypothetical protein
MSATGERHPGSEELSTVVPPQLEVTRSDHHGNVGAGLGRAMPAGLDLAGRWGANGSAALPGRWLVR